MDNENKCAVVIPIYKTELSNFEKISLEQVYKVLGAFQIIIVKPQDLIPPDRFPKDTLFISFDNKFFKDIHGYNQLMLSEEFYAKFLKFEKILIYQLDAFVFSNTLNYWCNQDFDYVGAPWLRAREFHSRYKFYKETIKSYFHRRYNIIEKNGMPALDKQMADQVGNGGFSLRKTKAFYDICLLNKKKINMYLQKRHAYFNEDIFFSIEINRKKKVIKIPNYRKALGFAFETLPNRALQLNNNQLPFGCHAWEKNLVFWRPYFKNLGYTI